MTDTHRNRVWGILIAVIFSALAIPLVLSNAFAIMFSHMGMNPGLPWGSYLMFGPSSVLAVLTVIMSIGSLRSPDRRCFYRMETVLILMVASLLWLFGLSRGYALYFVLYSVTGILQLRQFWKAEIHEVPERHLKRVMVILTIATLIGGLGLAFGMVQAIPKMPADKRHITFVSGSLQFHDDWHKRLMLGRLEDDAEIQGMRFPKDSVVYFYDSGELMMAQLQEGNLRLQGMLCVGSENVHFHKSGKISSAVLAEDLLINGQWYLKGTFLAFDEDGKIIPRETESAEGG